MLNSASNSTDVKDVLMKDGCQETSGHVRARFADVDPEEAEEVEDSLNDEEEEVLTRFDQGLITFKSIVKNVLFHLGPLLFVAAYCAMCAALISYLETKHEIKERAEDIRDFNRTMEQILQLKSDETTRDITRDLRDILHNYAVLVDKRGIPTNNRSRWTYPAALFFTSTVVSTIGYGNLTPRSMYGRIFTMVFAFFGIPIMLIAVTRCGQGLAKLVSTIKTLVMSRLVKLIKCRLRCCDCCSNCHRKLKEKDDKREFRFAMVACIAYLIIYILFGTFLFRQWESWTMFEAFYFCFITMTTIGFGDIIPQHPMFMLSCSIYIIIGLALTSMCIELAEIEYVRQIKSFRKTIRKVEGHVMRVRLAASTVIRDGVKTPLHSLKRRTSDSESTSSKTRNSPRPCRTEPNNTEREA